MDKKFGQYWHCCIGESFSFDVQQQSKNALLIFYNENVGVLLYKS